MTVPCPFQVNKWKKRFDPCYCLLAVWFEAFSRSIRLILATKKTETLKNLNPQISCWELPEPHYMKNSKHVASFLHENQIFWHQKKWKRSISNPWLSMTDYYVTKSMELLNKTYVLLMRFSRLIQLFINLNFPVINIFKGWKIPPYVCSVFLLIHFLKEQFYKNKTPKKNNFKKIHTEQ